jgi:hypothetical protein
MSEEYKNTNPLKVAQDAERDLGSTAAKQGHSGSDSSKYQPILIHLVVPSPRHNTSIIALLPSYTDAMLIRTKQPTIPVSTKA